MRRTLTALLMLLATTATTPLSAQQSTSSESVTLNADQLDEVVNGYCGEARVLADAADGLRIQRDAMRAQRDQCAGALAQMQGVDASRITHVQDAAKMRVWVIVGVVLGFVGGGVVGYAVGSM